MFIKNGTTLIPTVRIKVVETSNFEKTGTIEVSMYDNNARYEISGMDAIEALMVLKPSVLEGRKGVKWPKGAWAFHNMIGHPVMQLLAWFGFKRAAIRFHDWTTPRFPKLIASD